MNMDRKSKLAVIASVLILTTTVVAQFTTKTTQYWMQEVDASQACPNAVSSAFGAKWCSDGNGGITMSVWGSAPFKLGPGGIGPSGTLAIGTVSTLPAGSNATVVNTGTPTAAVLNIGIPQGNPGLNASGCQVGQTMDGTMTIDASGWHFKVTGACH